MMKPNWLRAAILASTLALPALSGCNTDVARKDGTDQGPGRGALGTPDSGADSDPRRGSAATAPGNTGPN